MRRFCSRRHRESRRIPDRCGTRNRDRTPLARIPGLGKNQSRRPPAVRAMRRDQFDAAPCQPCPQRVAVVTLVGNHPGRLLAWPAPRGDPDGREPDFRRGCRVKLVSQRNPRAVVDTFRTQFPLGSLLPGKPSGSYFQPDPPGSCHSPVSSVAQHLQLAESSS